MIKFRQIIRPGDVGRDVKAVKIAYQKMNIKGSGGLNISSHKAGSSFVEVTKRVQLGHKLKVDGIYGEATHEIVAPHFTSYGDWLYRTAAKRKHQPPSTPDLSMQAAAKQLLVYEKQGRYHADNSADLPQIEAAAAGKPVWSQGGRYVYLDRRILDVLIYLINKGNRIGTYAMCSDHPFDSWLGHAGGHAVDISSINGVSVNTYSSEARAETLRVAYLLHDAPGDLKPWQLICGGYGYHLDSTIEALTIPDAAFYGYSTMIAHTNHIHCGYE